MTIERAPRRKVAPSQLGAIFVLVLGAWVHPAFSATGAGARCDQSMDALPMSATDESKLAIQVIDHGTSTAVAAGDESLDAEAGELAPASSGRPTPPRVDSMLRRIFDEAQLRQLQLAGPEPADEPLAVDGTEAGDEPAAVLDTVQTDGGAELPGYSADEMLRYRRQMFRKDI